MHIPYCYFCHIQHVGIHWGNWSPFNTANNKKPESKARNQVMRKHIMHEQKNSILIFIFSTLPKNLVITSVGNLSISLYLTQCQLV